VQRALVDPFAKPTRLADSSDRGWRELYGGAVDGEWAVHADVSGVMRPGRRSALALIAAQGSGQAGPRVDD